MFFENCTLSTKMALRTRSIMSLAYKLVDNFADARTGEVILFGGVVRDVIVPALGDGKDPFSKEYLSETKEQINDLDIYVKITAGDQDTFERLREWIGTSLTHKLREWDWQICKSENIPNYHLKARRLHLVHTVTDEKVQLDLVSADGRHPVDADVNRVRFSRSAGLVLDNPRFNPTTSKMIQKILETKSSFPGSGKRSAR